MATTVFQITPYSSFNLMWDGYTIPDYYHTVPFADRQDPTNYFQKVQKNDPNFRVQLLSDFTPTLRMYDCHDIFVKNISFTNRTIVGASFLVYDALVDFSDLDDEEYYLKLAYTDENDAVQTHRTYMLDVADDWPDTLLFEYTNTFNDKGVVFKNDDDSLLTFAFRIEASFDEYQPLSADIDYIDQVYDSEVLNNTPYDNHKLYIGTDQFTGGAPDWAIRKMNLIFTLNKVAIDNQYYNRVEGSKFAPTRPEHGVMINGQNVRPTYWSIDIIPNENLNLEQLTTGDIPTGDLIVVYKSWPTSPLPNFASSFSVSGVFNDNMRLVGFDIWNYGLNEFDMLIGTTLGASDITTVKIRTNEASGVVDLTGYYDIAHVFHAATTVFVTVPDGVNLKVYIEYTQLDAKPVTPTGGSGSSPKGTVTIYEEITPGDFVLDWDIGTGLGLRNWVGWCLCGTNGTKERAHKYSQGWNRTEVGPSTRGTSTGAPGSEITLTRAELPAEGIALFDGAVNNTRGDIITTNSNVARASNSSSGIYLNYELVKGVSGEEPSLGISQKLGSGDPTNITPDSWIDVWVVKLTD